ncbi:gas vesicle protein GvpL/GvpF [Murinocardiopsis flavida]|uniref:Gas vesicle protein GvpL/GvpF n=1 Tax=Murinocardiopsis flavida TaxID=645275 RepID=A0A2P8DL66_9ACTN|nr:GvpL/GvpF family gas vesicle protein [Murinocardiopsis flavida]PSK97967.1 gas vesicle protein GvpL/GvpF [Murinocardiopsis flavida]
MSETARASYVYAVARPFGPDPLESVTGVGGYPVHLVVQDDLAAVVSTVPLHEFDADALKANLEDLRWLEEVARAHHSVVEAAARATVAVPLRLATVYHSDDRVRTVLSDDYAVFDRALRRLTGRLEFGVKIYADPKVRAAAPAPARQEQAPPDTSPGKAYLRKRRAQRERRDDTWQAAADLVDRTDAALREWSEARERHRPQDASLSGAAGENVLNAAYLVPEEHAANFLATLERLRAEAPDGTRIDGSGPWAPYSFASLDQEGERT